jgi:hypothetical protein
MAERKSSRKGPHREVRVAPLTPEQQAALGLVVPPLTPEQRTAHAEQRAAVKAFGERYGYPPERLAKPADQRLIADRLARAEAGTPEPGQRHPGGAPPEHDWEGAVCHVNAWVKDNGSLPRHKDGTPNKTRAGELITEYFKKLGEKPPTPPSIARWLRKNPQPDWWKPKPIRTNSN